MSDENEITSPSLDDRMKEIESQQARMYGGYPRMGMHQSSSFSDRQYDQLVMDGNMVQIKEPWYKKAWRPMAAFMYLLIVLFDFLIMPTYYSMVASSYDISEVINQVMILEGETLRTMAFSRLTEDRRWESLTLQGNGFFHIAMGAIIGVAAYTRGSEKQTFAQQGVHMN